MSEVVFPHRLRNTGASIGQLARNERGLLLRNALLDTTKPLDLPIPAKLRAAAPGSYIVQSRGPMSAAFRQLIERSGGSIISYIPNNSLLIRGAAVRIQDLQTEPGVQAVLPYEPYFKLAPDLIDAAISDSAGPDSMAVNVLAFPGARDEVAGDLVPIGAELVAEQSSPFGRVLRVRTPRSGLAKLASLPGVEEIEPARSRVAANDLSRVVMGIAPDLTSPNDYLGLTGTNIVVNVNDFGFDTNQPDLLGRMTCDVGSVGTDTNGHGTLIAGIIAGNGAESLTISNVPGSGLVPAERQFRGKAPGATLFGIGVGSAPAFATDSYLQRTAATKAFISNNSWSYQGDAQYDLAAASYDAAVRDALPEVPGSQPLLLVFAAGNSGHGADDGTGGLADSILSPGTAKNVLTIGAIEQARYLTNATWSCTNTDCLTNSPWLPLTDSSNQVASFSGRGNVGVGMEGPFGRFKPDLVAPGTFILSTRSAGWDQAAYYARTNEWLCQAPDENYSEVLSNLNESVGPYYRFESGTSLAAAAVSGTLALMQEFFEQRLDRTNSPALMKALLINGAAALTNLYGLQVQATTNWQGWGLVNLPNSLPVTLTNASSSTNGVFLVDQDPASALSTGESRTWYVSLSTNARTEPFRVTLVWTDPPGNPIASLKLVNDLDLVVTNLDTGEVFFGNDIAAGRAFNSAWDTNRAPNVDVVNNVENVFLAPRLGANYSVTILAHRVNVNAVTGRADAVLQDYALVISSDDREAADALTISTGSPAASTAPLVTVLTNSFLADASDTGTVLWHQRVGAGVPLAANDTFPLPLFPNASLSIGDSNQWHFYVITNDQAFTNAAFFTFQAQTLSAGPVGTVSPLAPAPTNAARAEADIDLYVSTDSALTNLDPTAVAAADKSLGRGGAETILYSNALPTVYYVGVKSECQDAAEYGFGAVFSESPFAQMDDQNNELVRGLPAPALVPGGTPANPGLASVFGLAANPIIVRRVIVTNTLSASALGELEGSLFHNGTGVVLNEFSTNGPVLDQSFVYDDSGEGDLAGGQPPDGPGTLRDFAAQPGFGQWQLSLLDTNQPATNENLSIFLEAQPDLTGGMLVTVQPGGCRRDYVYLPMTVTNLTTMASLQSGSGPIAVQVFPAGISPQGCPTLQLTPGIPSGALTVDATTHPPLVSGLYVVECCNLGPDAATLALLASLSAAPNPPPVNRFVSSDAVPILDDAVTASSITVTNANPVLSVSVGVRLDHPRVSDLALRLVSPSGARVLLDENRGGGSVEGMGLDTVVTNNTPVSYSGGPDAVTNMFDIGRSSGNILIDYDFYSLADDMRVYYEGQLLFDSGLISGAGSTNLNFGPGASSLITVVMNQGGNADTNTAWFYRITSTRVQPIYFTFTENTNLTMTPVKFATAPFTNVTSGGSPPVNGIFYLPEESLNRLVGQSAAGKWTLELADTRAGATNPPPTLLSWSLMLRLADTTASAVPLGPGGGWTNLLGPGQIQWFSVNTPKWVSFASNALFGASAPVNVFFNAARPPTGTNAGDVLLLGSVLNGTSVLTTNGTPPLAPGTVYYLGVQNTNATTVRFGVQVGFDVPSVITLANGFPYANNNAGPLGAADYYLYTVSTNAVRAQFEIDAPAADLTLVARKGLPLPSPRSYDYLSANPSTNEELIVVFNSSTPVPLAPGDWYLAVINANGAPTPYTIMASEYPVYGTNLTVTSQTAGSTSLCLTWNSLPGVHYFVQGKVALTDPRWMPVSPTIVAWDITTSYCINLPSPFNFFRVSEGLVLGFPPPTITSIAATTNGVALQWSAATNLQFRVEWSPDLALGAWTAFTNVITSSSGAFGFIDDGTQTAGLGPARFYRLRQLVPP